ncbi:beta-L-arabinofuranosidase domain-containing protein [Pedobacter panaciterrae]
MNVKKSLILAFASIPSLLFAQNSPGKQYVYNRAPLTADTYIQLPLGSIKAKGWLLKQLELQKDGATGHAEELYPEASNLGPESDWLGGNGEGWERVPYYVKGLIALAYTLDNPELKAKSQKWINWTLDHQQANGAFGPAKMNDWWPRMPMMYAIQSYYEATGDERVLGFFTKYFKYQLENLDKKPLTEWSKSRTGDNIELVLWLYNRTGQRSLLTLAEKLKSQAYPWADIYTNNQFYHYGDDFHTKHSVSVGQALKLPAIYSQLSNTPFYRDATEKGIYNLIRDHGQASGIASGTEFLAGRSSFQGTETCTVVEWMQSLETTARIVHDAQIGDRLEKIAFNTLPSQFSRDIKSHLYYTQPNQVVCKHGNSGFDEDYDGGILLSPYSGMGCCRYNMHMGWPYFVKNSWAATPDKGLAVIAYAPVELNAIVADAVPVKLNVVTNYPFEEQIRIKIDLAKAATFPLKLRIPEWCKNPQIAVNGKALPNVKTGQVYTVNRSWSSNDKVVLNFPMEVKVSDQVNQSVTVERGPLVYGLQMNAKYSIRKKHPVEGFFDYEVSSASPWNYGLVIDRKNLAASVKVQNTAMPENPFIQATTPVKLKVSAKKIPSWTMAYNKMHAFEVPRSPVASSEQTEEITLTPFGSENIRISNFPVIGTPESPRKLFKENFDNATVKDWLLYGGSWFIKDGAIHAASNKGSWGYGIHGSKAIASSTMFKDLSYEATVQLNSKGNAGLVFRVTDAVLGADMYKGYYLGIDAETGTIQLGKSSDQKWVALASEQQKLEIGKSYKVKIEAKGSDIKVYFNGSEKPLISVKDSEFKSGMIGVRAYDSLASIDNLLVKEVK